MWRDRQGRGRSGGAGWCPAGAGGTVPVCGVDLRARQLLVLQLGPRPQLFPGRDGEVPGGARCAPAFPGRPPGRPPGRRQLPPRRNLVPLAQGPRANPPRRRRRRAVGRGGRPQTVAGAPVFSHRVRRHRRGRRHPARGGRPPLGLLQPNWTEPPFCLGASRGFGRGAAQGRGRGGRGRPVRSDPAFSANSGRRAPRFRAGPPRRPPPVAGGRVMVALSAMRIDC